jgi:hypothetical protein
MLKINYELIIVLSTQKMENICVKFRYFFVKQECLVK